MTHSSRSMKETQPEPRTQVRGPLFFSATVGVARNRKPTDRRRLFVDAPRRRSFKMLINRITAYLPAAEEEQLAEKAMPQDASNFQNPLTPPANFAPVPQGLVEGLSNEKLAWQQELYRTAYQSALAEIASAAFRRAQRN
jgi:hypothetical protein